MSLTKVILLQIREGEDALRQYCLWLPFTRRQTFALSFANNASATRPFPLLARRNSIARGKKLRHFARQQVNRPQLFDQLRVLEIELAKFANVLTSCRKLIRVQTWSIIC